MAAPAANLTTPLPASRHAGLDALRGLTTLLVVLHHTAITYGAVGGWFYREVSPDGSLSGTLLLFFCTLNQAWFMGLFFLLAGAFTPAALQRDGRWGHLRQRGLRLGVPLLVFGAVLGPATVALAHTAQGQPFIDTLLAQWRLGRWEPGPLWFSQALLGFALLATLWPARWRRAAWLPGPHSPWPGHSVLAVAALTTTLAALALRSVWPVGRAVWGMQWGYFASYTVLFAFGCVAAAPGWLTHVPPDVVRTWRRVARWALPSLPLLYLAGRVWPALGDRALEVAYALWEPLVAWGVILVLLQRFADPAGPPGRWRPQLATLARRAYTIFIIHPPVVVAVALAWRTVAAPALLKFALTGALSCLLCYAIAGLLLRVRPLRRLL